MKKENGFYYGLNATSKNIIMSFEEKISQKENELILGETGGGMSFTHKIEQIENFDKHINWTLLR